MSHTGELSLLDTESGLFTKRAFEETYEARRQAGSQSLSIILLAIDQHDILHKTPGQGSWQQAVEMMGHAITTALQNRHHIVDPVHDFAARYGDNRFIILLSDPSPGNPEELVSEIRATLRTRIEAVAFPTPLSLQSGLAMGRPQDEQDLIATAETALGKPAKNLPRVAPGAGTTERMAPPSPLHNAEMPTLDNDSPSGTTILVIDDEPGIRLLIQEFLSDSGATVLTAKQADEALRILETRPVDIVVSDILLPGLNGLDLIKKIRDIDSTVAVIMVTGSHNLNLAVDAIRSGADDYLVKPFGLEDLRASVARGLAKRQRILGGKAYQASLEGKVEQATAELQQTLRHLQTTYRTTLKALGAALDTRDIETHAHSERVAQYALTLGRVLNLSSSDLVTLERGVYLHDIGKIGIPDDVLLKQDSLDDEEWKVMRQHPELGYRLASRIDFLKDAAHIILSHHERFDGAGYPRGLKGAAIPIGARVFAVVDALDAITSDRVYRKAQPFESARAEILRYSGTQFDPVIVEAFLSVPTATWNNIREAVNLQALAEENIPPPIKQQMAIRSR